MKKYILNLCVGLVIILPTIILAQGWVARYNGPGNDDDFAYAIALDNSGNIYVTGFSWGSGTYVDFATVKYNSSGVEQWVSRYNGPGNDGDWASAIALDNSDNVYITGYSEGSGTSVDFATIKYNSSGVEQWVARYNGPGNGYDRVYAIALDNSGNIYVTGWSRGSGTNADYATVKYDSSGVEQWVARYNGPGNDGDYAYAIALDNSDNIYVTGLSWGSGTERDYATVKYNSSGVEQWVARYNGPGNDGDWASAIALDNSDNVYITGYSEGSGTSVDFATIKYNSSGVEQFVARYNGPGNDWDGARAIALDNSGNVYITGGSMGSGTDYDYATIKYSQVGVEEEVGSNKQETRLEIYQNPSRDKVDIRWQITENIERNLIIYNATGRLIKEFHITDHSFNRVTWDGRDNSGKKVPSGIYFLKFQAGSYIETKKIILFR